MIAQIAMYVMAFLYVLAGVNHFINPKFYIKIMPNWMPWHSELVAISGVTEIILGVLLIPQLTRPYAAWLIVAMLVVFFTVHVDMILVSYQKGRSDLWLLVARFFFQFVLIWWAWLYTK